MDSAQKKLCRSLLNSIREACVYARPLSLYCDNSRFDCALLEMQESNARSLEEKRVLTFKLPAADGFNKDTTNLMLQIEQSQSVLTVPLTIIASDSGSFHTELSVEHARLSNRRSSSRQSVKEAFFVPVLLYPPDEGSFPVTAFASVLDFDENAIRFKVQTGYALSKSDLIDSKVFFQDSSFLNGVNGITIHSVRELEQISRMGETTTSATAISVVKLTDATESDEAHLIQPENTLHLDIRPFIERSEDIRVTVTSLTKSGVSGSIPSGLSSNLPPVFLAEHVETKVRFQVRNSEMGVILKIASDALGQRTQWLNYITHQCLGYEYRFHPKDARELTRLMLESGAYSMRAIADMTLLEGYLQSKWPLEQGHPRTKYRWLVRDNRGRVIGHTAGVQVSDRVWAAIDNIGSQSYKGSWNREFVARWLRIFAQHLRGHATDPLIIWTFTPSAGVWTKFDEKVASQKEKYYCRNRIWGFYLVNVPEVKGIRRDLFTVEEVPHSELNSNELSKKLCKEVAPLFNALYDGTYSESSFYSNFEHDYSCAFKRFTYLIKKKGAPSFILSFSNYPDWASLNRGQDPQYLFPLGPSIEVLPEEEAELFAVMREAIFRAGNTPYRVCLVSENLRLSVGSEWTNYLLKPEALEIAAESLELS